MPRYWVNIDGAVEGPYELQSLRFVEGFTRDTPVSPDSAGQDENWIKASQIPELLAVLEIPNPVSAPAPAPPPAASVPDATSDLVDVLIQFPGAIQEKTEKKPEPKPPAKKPEPAAAGQPVPIKEKKPDPVILPPSEPGDFVDIPIKPIIALLLFVALLAGAYWKRQPLLAALRRVPALKQKILSRIPWLHKAPEPVKEPEIPPAPPPIPSLIEPARVQPQEAILSKPQIKKPASAPTSKPKPKPKPAKAKPAQENKYMQDLKLRKQKYLLPGVPAPDSDGAPPGKPQPTEGK